jgi:hypothetical protein
LTGVLLSLLLWLVPAWLPAPEPAAGPEAERLRTAKALFFDRKYDEAREAWKAVLARSSGPQAATAAYWVARCSESLGQAEQAFGEYGQFLEREGGDVTLREEARTSRVGLAARLLKQGRAEFRPPLRAALKDPSQSVRYFAAVQMAMLGECDGATQILRRVVAVEKDGELVQRARLGLLRCDPQGRAESRPRTPRGGTPAASDARWVKLRIFETSGKLKISINVPLSLAEVLFKSLPEDAKKDLVRKGYNPDTFWEQLNRLPRLEILEIVGEDGGRIQIWIE